MYIDRNKVINVFNNYVADYDITDVKVRLKVEHTSRVADLCEKIAESLSLSMEDVDLAWLLGMLHDLGRFEQLRRYDTFDDSVSVNHAALSADLLYKEGRIRDYVEDTAQDSVIEKAVRLHNVYALPEALPEREKMFAQILRDADKVDILKVNCDIPMEEIYNIPLENFLKDPISPKVMEAALAHENVNRAYTKTSVDHLVGHISLTFGLVYPESVRLAQEQGYLEQMLTFQSNNPQTQKDLAKLKESIHEYMNMRMAV